MSLQPDQRSGVPSNHPSTREVRRLNTLSAFSELLRPSVELQLPEPSDLAGAAMTLAKGVRTKYLLPIAQAPIEYAFVRRGEDVYVSAYGTESTPVIYLLNRRLSLRLLLDTCAEVMMTHARSIEDSVERQIALRVADSALHTSIEAVQEAPEQVIRQGGVKENSKDTASVSFGYRVAIMPSADAMPDRAARSDLHALLFDGELWINARGRRTTLVKGPVMLAAMRMIDAVSSLVEAWESGRPLSIRLHAGSFFVSVRMTTADSVSLSFGAHASQTVMINDLSVADAALPILRLVSELTRTLILSDRTQAKNLRVRELRQRLRELRNSIKSRRRAATFVNRNPERVRLEHQLAEEPRANDERPMSSLRFAERWRISIDHLDPQQMFLCGDRIVLFTQEHTLALSREEGDVIWARPGQNLYGAMAGTTLLRVEPDGNVELCNLSDGEPYANARVNPTGRHLIDALHVGGAGKPPVVVVSESASQLIALDLRTGEARWRFSSQAERGFRLMRSGNLVVMACGEGSLHTLDAVSGEDVWRFSSPARFSARPVLSGDTVVALAGRGRGQSTLYGVDLFSGAMRWEVLLEGESLTDPLNVGERVLIATNSRFGALLTAYHGTTGQHLWSIEDPGLSRGGVPLALDNRCVINMPNGDLVAVDCERGTLGWTTRLADPLQDEAPRCLEPVLRGGALFVPAKTVHIVSPREGKVLSELNNLNLVPDWVRVDERGWVYVGEEGGVLAAFGAAPQLTMIRGGLALKD